MEEKRGTGRAKRPAKPPDDGSWDCSVCTFKNSAEAYKCEMCDVRKGTSTRKPRLNQQLVAQQVAQQYAAPLSPTPGSPLQDDDNDPLFPDPIRPVANDDDTFELPPPPPKPSVKKEKAPSLNKAEKAEKGEKVEKGEKGEKGEKAEKSHPQHKQSTQPKQNKQIKKRIRPPQLKNVDRTSAQQIAVTVDNLTVVITDYPSQTKRMKISPTSEVVKSAVQSDVSDTSSNASNDILEERMAPDSNT